VTELLGCSLASIPELRSWLLFFRARRDRVVDLPWEEEPPLAPEERARIARSIATFQLGESSDGSHLRASAERFGGRAGLPELPELTELFIREEQLHASLLAGFMKRHDIPLLHGEWTDRVFRWMRRWATFNTPSATATTSPFPVARVGRACSA